ncbi:MAG: HAD-IA family hydrolase [archaeon]
MIDLIEYARFLVSGKGDSICTGRADSVFGIDYRKLARSGKKLVIFDADETLSKNHGKLPKETLALLRALLKLGFKLAILSNCGRKRREALRKMLGRLPVLVGETGNKPNREGFARLMADAGASPEKTIMVGDKPGVDLWGAYVSGIRERILVGKYSGLGGRKKKLS